MKASRRQVVERWPWDPIALAPREISALKAMDDTAYKALLKICGYGANPFCGGADDGRRATDFACGKHWVGGTLTAFRTMKMPGPKPDETGPHAVPKGAPPGET